MLRKFQYFLLPCLAACPYVLGQDLRDRVTIIYEYQLEVDHFLSGGSPSAESTRDTLSRIDSSLTQDLQEMLRNNDVTIYEQIPTVVFLNVSSDIYSACYTSSAECSLVRSNLVVAFVGRKPKHSVEHVTVGLVRDYLQKYGLINPQVTITFHYPFFVDSLAEFQLETVDSVMGEVEIAVMEESFLDVFGAVVFAIEGDTEILDSTFIYQDLVQIFKNETIVRTSNDERNPQTNLKVELNTLGICRECSKVEYAAVVDAVIAEKLDAFRDRLKANGELANSSYFENVREISFALPTLPDSLPPIDDGEIYDSQPPKTDTGYPWYFYFALAMSICIVLSGLYIVYKDQSDLDMEKDDDQFSTGSESDVASDFENESKVVEYHVKENQDESVDHPSLEGYQVETILSTAEHTQGEYTDPLYERKNQADTMTSYGNGTYAGNS
jgi:hypothetical protein